MPKTKIETYLIDTVMGRITKPFGAHPLHFLTINEQKQLDVIGYTGTKKGPIKKTREEYLNSLNKGNFKVEQTKSDFGDFHEKFTIVRVIDSE